MDNSSKRGPNKWGPRMPANAGRHQGMNYKFASYVDETLKVYLLGGLGVIRGIYPSF